MFTDEEWAEWASGERMARARILSNVRARTGMGLQEIMDAADMRLMGITQKDLTPLALYKAIQSLRNELLG